MNSNPYIKNPRVHACKDIHITGTGDAVECGRTPGHSGVHMDSAVAHRWMPPLQVIDGDAADTDASITATPTLTLVKTGGAR